MSTQSPPLAPDEVEYPDCNGEPMSDNTLQFQWITTIVGNLEALYRNEPSVFVAGDLLWYPIYRDNQTRTAPDAMVVFGRPKGYRGSYKQWEEGGIGPQVVFEILSPGNRASDLAAKFAFYQRFEVEEYYQYDPDRNVLKGWVRDGVGLKPIASMESWVSPRLGIRFVKTLTELTILGPNARPFLTFAELAAEAEQAREAIARAERLAAQLRALGIEPEA